MKKQSNRRRREPFLICHPLISLALLIGASVLSYWARAEAEATQDLMDYLQPADNQAPLWRFSRAEQLADGTVVERFDPTLSEKDRWQLVSINGQTPTTSELKAYAKDYEKRDTRDSPVSVDPLSLVDVQTLELIKETESELHYGFSPLVSDEDDREVFEHLAGFVEVDKHSGNILISLKNKSTFSPAPMVKIQELTITMLLGQLEENAPHALTQFTSLARGRFMRFKKIEES
ncbi:MAG: hypothetical protein AAGJ86_05550, partial [Pseudomonadota bacterium]